jgi:dTDP-4-dehydrorhamnose 3,5-epimerase-like enzyme
VHEDSRGWFKENWQREKMTALGLPDFGPVQHNVSFNAAPWRHPRHPHRAVGQVRLGRTGRVFGAWVDMREGDSFGTTFTSRSTRRSRSSCRAASATPTRTLEDATTYSYLVNDHWRPAPTYPALNLADPTVAIPGRSRSPRRRSATRTAPTPMLADVDADEARARPDHRRQRPARPGAQADFPGATSSTAPSSTSPTRRRSPPGPGTSTPSCSTPRPTPPSTPPRRPRAAGAWAANATGPATLARLAREHRFTLVHYSTDYVFDGTAEEHTEDEPLSPLGVYGQSKAAGDLAVATAPRHYVLRTSWVIGEGNNFVRTMQRSGRRRRLARAWSTTRSAG